MKNPAVAGRASHATGCPNDTPPENQKQAEPKPHFAALPSRAIPDQRLTGLHLKALGAIAMHDRLGKNRQGCWAGNRRLAELIGCNYSNLSTTLTDLATWGYIEREPHPLNKRLRVFRVIYTDDDKAVMKGAQNTDSLPTDKESAGADSLPSGEETFDIVCPDFQESPEIQEDRGVEYIPQKRGIDKAEALGKNSVETARRAKKIDQRSDTGTPRDDELQQAGMYLRKVEETFSKTNGRRFTKGELDYFRHHANHCAQLEDRWLGGSPEEERIGYWAQRLASEIMDKMVEVA